MFYYCDICGKKLNKEEENFSSYRLLLTCKEHFASRKNENYELDPYLGKYYKTDEFIIYGHRTKNIRFGRVKVYIKHLMIEKA